jgi:hypothetical protein
MAHLLVLTRARTIHMPLLIWALETGDNDHGAGPLRRPSRSLPVAATKVAHFQR